MPVSIPVPARSPGDLLTSALWNAQVKDNINKLLDRGHRVLTVAQFAALTGLEGTKGTVAPDEVYLEVDAANGIQWHLAYESGETTYKWRYLGGPPMQSEVLTTESTTSAAYADLATVGPSITAARGGDYDVEIELIGGNDAGGITMAAAIGATVASDNWRAVPSALGTPAAISGSATARARHLAVAASAAIVAKYKAANSPTAANARNRRLRVWPVRVV